MRYYPLNRVKTNLKAVEESLYLNGKPYSGYYYETYDGQYFTGKDPIEGPSQRLTLLNIQGKDSDDPLTIVDGNESYNSITNLNVAQIKTFKEPKPFYPAPTDVDYKRGAFVRYFAKKRDRAGFVLEVNKETFDSLQRVDSVYDYVNYEVISLFWQITGPLNDDRTNKQYKVAGIIDTNKRLVESKEKSFPGLKAFIGEDYTRFAKPVGR